MASLFYILFGFLIALFILKENPSSIVWGIGSEEKVGDEIATPLVGLITVAGVMFVTLVGYEWLLSPFTFYLYMAMVGYACLYIKSIELERLVDLLTGPVFVAVFLLGSWVEKIVEKDGAASILLGVASAALSALYVLNVVPRPVYVFIGLLGIMHRCTKKCVSCNFSPALSALQDRIESLQGRLVEMKPKTILYHFNNFFLAVVAGNITIMTIGELNTDSEVPLRHPLGKKHAKGCVVIKKWLLNDIGLGR